GTREASMRKERTRGCVGVGQVPEQLKLICTSWPKNENPGTSGGVPEDSLMVADAVPTLIVMLVSTGSAAVAPSISVSVSSVSPATNDGSVSVSGAASS